MKLLAYLGLIVRGANACSNSNFANFKDPLPGGIGTAFEEAGTLAGASLILDIILDRPTSIGTPRSRTR